MPSLPPSHRKAQPHQPTSAKRVLARKLRNSRRWRKVREIKISAHPLCEYCGAAGEQVHHIAGLAERPDLAYDMDNLATVCTGCHAKLENGENLTLKRGWLDELDIEDSIGVYDL